MPDGTSDGWREGFNYAMNVMAFWLDFQRRVQVENPGGSPSLSRVGMWKSALLGRLIRGEEVRRRPCPKHRGVMWCSLGLDEAAKPCPCQGTGWLPNEGESGA